jgi:hypothetical protein
LIQSKSPVNADIKQIFPNGFFNIFNQTTLDLPLQNGLQPLFSKKLEIGAVGDPKCQFSRFQLF